MFEAGSVKTGAAGAIVSIVNARVAVPTFPAVSTARTVTEWDPSASAAVVKGEVQDAKAPASVAQVTAPRWASVAVKAMLAVAVLSCWPAVGVDIDTTGAIVSETKLRVAVAAFPAASTCLTETECAPFVEVLAANGELQLPNAPPSVEQEVVPRFASVTVKTMLVLSPGTTCPSVGDVIVTTGAVVSTVIVRVADAAPVLPTASVAVAVIACARSASALGGVKLQTPLPLAVAVPSSVAPSNTRIVEFASALPPSAGVVFAVTTSVAGVVMLGAVGAVVSTVKLRLFDCAPVIPRYVGITYVECAPSLSATGGL
jgi:hypothetical protein